jgi:acetyltransferase
LADNNKTGIEEHQDLSFFLDPKGVAVVGASNRSGSWGYRIAKALLDIGYQGALRFVNPNAQEVLGIKTYPRLEQVPGEVELAVVAIPAERIWGILEACVGKGVKGIVIISSGFGEALAAEGKRIEEEMARFCKTNGIRIIGPNVSGIYNLHRNFNATGEPSGQLRSSSMSFICQGGFAIHDIVNRGRSKGLGLGKFVHTGNEADLQSTDFLEVLGEDPETEVILIYMEGIKEPRRFLKIARRISPKKPILVYKGGRTRAGNRAVASHTGALAGNTDTYHALLRQAGCIMPSNFETILELGHAFTFYPPLRGSRVCIVTIGGSWGVMLTDHVARKGLQVPELSPSLQKKLRNFGMPYRASTRNPIDFGAAGFSLENEAKISILEALLASTEIDALIYHGHGFGGIELQSPPDWLLKRQRGEEELLRGGVEMMRVHEKPFLIGCHNSPLESATVRNLVQDGIPVFTRLEDIADCLSVLHLYYQNAKT